MQPKQNRLILGKDDNALNYFKHKEKEEYIFDNKE